LRFELDVREGAEHAEDKVTLRCRSNDVRQVGIVPDEVRRQELLDGIQVVGVPCLDPATNRRLVLLYRHRRRSLSRR